MKRYTALSLATMGAPVVLLGLMRPAPAPTANAAEAMTSSAADTFILSGLETRASRRAYYGAPPVVPHRLGRSQQECLSCHLQKRTYKGQTSTLTPHPERVNCVQCHVRGTQPRFIQTAEPVVNSHWLGEPEPAKIAPVHAFAPPLIPHKKFLRTNCSACHSARYPGESGLPGPHPTWSNCRQCHVSTALD